MEGYTLLHNNWVIISKNTLLIGLLILISQSFAKRTTHYNNHISINEFDSYSGISITFLDILGLPLYLLQNLKTVREE
jgi:hypothetical protein